MLKIAETFYSIQGEGAHAGRPAVFIRLQGCNLRCPWCDEPEALAFNGDALAVEEHVLLAGPHVKNGNGCSVMADILKCHMVVLTGGEPTAQDLTKLILMLPARTLVCIETNGTLAPDWLFELLREDLVWLTLSPKPKEREPLKRCLDAAHEIKYVVEADTDIQQEFDWYSAHTAPHAQPWFFLQPEDGAREAVMQRCVDFVKANPLEARLSLRLHNLLGVK